MAQTAQRNVEILQSIVREVTPQLFDAYGSSIQHVAEDEQPAGVPLPDLAGVLGFVGDDLHGTITLATSYKALRSVMDHVPGVVSAPDWLAELTNQLLGRIKTRLLRLGAPVHSSTPVVVSGYELKVKMGEHSVNCCHLFSAPNGRLQVWLGVEIVDDFELTPKADGEDPPTEGDMLLF